jgi:hypothetical protein
MGEEGKVVDQIWEKVDNPLELTPQPNQTIQPPDLGEPLPTETPTPPVEEATPEGSDQ